MARPLGSVRLRWIVLLLAAGVIFVLSDVLFTWRQLTTSAWSAATSPRAVHSGDTRANPATIQAIYDAVAKASDSADVQKLTQLVDRLSESEATDLLRKIDPKTTTAATAAITAAKTAASVPPVAVSEDEKDDDTLRIETEQLKAQEVEAMKEENRIKMLESQLLHSLHTTTQKTTAPRGIVLPLYDDLVPLGLSLIIELRSLGAMLPVEIPHCGDLNPKFITTIEKRSKQLGQVDVYDVCDLATKEKSLLDASKPIFCKDLDECHSKFRTFDIKILADQPDQHVVGFRPASRLHSTDLRHYLSNADVSVFRQLPTLQREKATVVNDVALPFEPSDILLNSHAWNGRSGHQMDSSLLLWSKKRQPRATAVLASFIALNDVGRPPSYGDKELFFVACELAETQYTFSDFGVGAAGSDFKDHGEDKSIICGQRAQGYYCARTEPAAITPAPTSLEPQAAEQVNKWAEFMKNARERAELEKQMETRLIHSLHTLSQQTSVPRGIVLPLYDKITTLGVSLILQLRSLGVDLPIEIPHCGDFDEAYGETIMKKRDSWGKSMSIVLQGSGQLPPSLPELRHQGTRRRLLALRRVMLMDADALLFQSPMSLWETNKYQTTGTLFFNDRIAEANFSMGLGYKPANRPNIMAIEDYLSKADVDLFRNIPTLARPNASAELIAADKSTVTLHFQPSEGLLKSHPWNGRSAHRVDSSILLWNKKRQPRATAILASIISLNDVPRPPSYGDKEFFFVACELAEAQYSFSDFATGSAGTDFRNKGENKSIICGSAAHHFPEKSEDTPIQEVGLLYMNTDYIMRYKPKKAPMYYSAARPRDFFPGTFEERKLLMMCPFDITGVKITDAEAQQIYQRQHFFGIAKEWEDDAKEPTVLSTSLIHQRTRTKTHRKRRLPSCKRRRNKLREQEKQLVHTLNQIAQQTTVKRGIVIPVYDGIIKLAISLAERATSVMDSSRKVFCEKIEDCHAKFRGFIIKPLAVNVLKSLVQSSCGPSSGLVAGVVEQEAATARYCDSGIFHCAKRYSVPPSYGDKEFFFYASELAEAQYSFSDHAIGAVGTKLIDGGPKNSTLCGDMAQVFPIHQDGVPDDDVPLFYFNSDRILWFRPKTEPVYYMKARPWEFYPGPFGERKQECPFGITAGKLSTEEERHLAGRQHIYEAVDAWHRVAKEKPANLDEQNIAIDGVLRKVIAEMQGKSPADVAPAPPRENKQNDQVERTTEMMERQLVYTLSQITQRTTTKRGIVMPLYEPIARLGLSLILELRAMGITLPIEVPHCTDLKLETVELIRTKKELGEIRAYDVCELAASAKSVTNASRPVFCDDIDGCRVKFRSFMIKPLAVSYSQFEEILMLDADTTFFVNPTVLFESEKFKTTGNLLMHDRISHDWWFMAEHRCLRLNAQSYRRKQNARELNFEPSDFLLSSHSFNLRSGHQVDSSLVMWSKKRQPRATAILASFVAQNDIASPPSYGDKELFFYANELAETQYSFSDHAIGAVGTKVEDGGPKNSTLCGDMAQVFPIHQDGVPDDDVPLFYLNSDRILHFKPDVEPVYYMKARPWAHYPGAFGKRPQECPFNITVGRFVESHINHLAERRKLWEQVKAW
ncbi:Nucleotide-diphospho-sugar transferase [Phytophthora cactorum]|nr:Nucleotide-diphospho-sugar transferase [Phytophthora cactorum]